MVRERTLKVALVVVGIVFLATIYPLLQMQLAEDLQMMLSVYVTLGVFLLLAARNPSEHRSLIGFAGWSSLVHAGVMAVQSRHDAGERMHLLMGTAIFAIIGAALVGLLPRRTASVTAMEAKPNFQARLA